MESIFWRKPVSIKLADARNLTCLVSDTLVADSILNKHWPHKITPKVSLARTSCAAALEGGDGEDAQIAFEAAAQEAGILVT